MIIANTLAFLVLVAPAAANRLSDIERRTPLYLSGVTTRINGDPSVPFHAALIPRFENITISGAKRLMGTVLPGHRDYYQPLFERVFSGSDTQLPKTFDAREAFSECAGVIGHVRDQSNCGSCWVCIEHGIHYLMSPEDTMSCCSGLSCGLSRGCDGGQPSGAWKWFESTGVTTGGDYTDVGDAKSCKPYTLGGSTSDVPYDTPICTSSCTEKSYPVPYHDDKFFAKSHYSIKHEKDIQREIFERGSISVALSVYEDFMSYSSGIYQYTYGELLGGHAVKMLGWGVGDDGTAYWLCMNSWGTEWGEKGFFRIRRGTDECGIEDSCVAGEV